MIEILGWSSTLLVLIGYIFNSREKIRLAMITWITGDIGWIIYDFYIDNISHLFLSLIIISINLYGIYRIKNKVVYDQEHIYNKVIQRK
ncbi:MAG: YgjV family protein [Pelagibacterales bacterium]|nr:YgjV family protein [Pelagibacterales bacterium]